MALIKCEECGREISDRAKSCPNCGCPVSIRYLNINTDKKYAKTKNKLLLIVVIVVAAGLIFYLNINKIISNKNSGSDYSKFENGNANIDDELVLPNDLNEEQLNILDKVKGTWELKKTGETY